VPLSLTSSLTLYPRSCCIEFRSGIADIEAFQNATAEELLAALQTLVMISDIGHNFPPQENGSMDVDLQSKTCDTVVGTYLFLTHAKAMMAIGFLPNYWTSVVEKWLPWKFDFAFLQGEGSHEIDSTTRSNYL